MDTCASVGGRPSRLLMGLFLLTAVALCLAAPGPLNVNRRTREVAGDLTFPLRFAGGSNAFQPSVGALSSVPLDPVSISSRTSPISNGPPIVFGPRIRPRPWRFWG